MKKIICLLFIIMIILLSIMKKDNQNLIPEKSIRFRIIANSNSVEDQKNKLKLKKELEQKIIYHLNTSDYKSTEDSIKASLNIIDDILAKKNIEYNISYGKNYFPEKDYKGILYKEGYYQSLVITLGEGLGDNWWCVLFPPLCLLDAEENKVSDVEYKLYAKEIINKIKH